MSDVALLHGLASSFEHNWQNQGWVALLKEEGHRVVPLRLPGHGPGPHSVNPASYANPAAAILDQLGFESAGPTAPVPVDAIGFSAGAEALLHAAIRAPGVFRRLALLGIGSSIIDSNGAGAAALADALAGDPDADDVRARLFRQMAAAAGNDLAPIVAYLRRPRRPLTDRELAAVRCPVLVVLGDRDPAGPADSLVAALPDARLVTLRGTDHFATTADPRAIDAVLKFLR